MEFSLNILTQTFFVLISHTRRSDAWNCFEVSFFPKTCTTDASGLQLHDTQPNSAFNSPLPSGSNDAASPNPTHAEIPMTDTSLPFETNPRMLDENMDWNLEPNSTIMEKDLDSTMRMDDDSDTDMGYMDDDSDTNMEIRKPSILRPAFEQTPNEQDQSNLSPAIASDSTRTATTTMSNTISSSEIESIKTVSQTTINLFSQAHKSTALDPHLRSTISDIQFGFLSWAGNVGALAHQKASLDYRLREDPDILDALRSTLELLNENLQQLLTPLHNIPEEEEESESVWEEGQPFDLRAVNHNSIGIAGNGLVQPELASSADSHAQTFPNNGYSGINASEFRDGGREYEPAAAESENGDDEGEADSGGEEESSMVDADDSEDERYKQYLFENEDPDSSSSQFSDTKMSPTQANDSDPTTSLSVHHTRSKIVSTYDSDEFESSSTESDSPTNNPLWGKKLKQVHQTIDQLLRFASVLRKPASSNENARVREFMARKTTEELEFLVFGNKDNRSKKHLLWWLNHFFPGLSEIVKERMLDSFVFRQMMLLYRERHQRKLEKGTLSNTMPDALVQQTTSYPTTLLSTASTDLVDDLILPSNTLDPSQTQLRLSATSTLGLRKPRDSSTILSSTIASSANRERFPAYERSVIGSAISRTGIKRREGLSVPSLLTSSEYEEAVSRRASQFKCSYCFKNIPLEDAKEPRASRHILMDLKPYVCLFPECKQSDPYFRTKEEWLSHMEVHACYWYCRLPAGSSHHDLHALGANSSSGGKCKELFYTQEDLESHLLLAHPEFTENQISNLVETSTISVSDTFGVLASRLKIGVDCCPICGKSPRHFEHTRDSHCSQSDWQYKHDPVTSTAFTLSECVLSHLEEFALRSVKEIPEDDLEGSQTDHRGFRSSHVRFDGAPELDHHDPDTLVGSWLGTLPQSIEQYQAEKVAPASIEVIEREDAYYASPPEINCRRLVGRLVATLSRHWPCPCPDAARFTAYICMNDIAELAAPGEPLTRRELTVGVLLIEGLGHKGYEDRIHPKWQRAANATIQSTTSIRSPEREFSGTICQALLPFLQSNAAVNLTIEDRGKEQFLLRPEAEIRASNLKKIVLPRTDFKSLELLLSYNTESNTGQKAPRKELRVKSALTLALFMFQLGDSPQYPASIWNRYQIFLSFWRDKGYSSSDFIRLYSQPSFVEYTDEFEADSDGLTSNKHLGIRNLAGLMVEILLWRKITKASFPIGIDPSVPADNPSIYSEQPESKPEAMGEVVSFSQSSPEPHRSDNRDQNLATTTDAPMSTNTEVYQPSSFNQIGQTVNDSAYNFKIPRTLPEHPPSNNYTTAPEIGTDQSIGPLYSSNLDSDVNNQIRDLSNPMVTPATGASAADVVLEKSEYDHRSGSRECTVCGTILPIGADFARHMREQHSVRPTRPFSCMVCGKACKRRAQLLDHQRRKGHLLDEQSVFLGSQFQDPTPQLKPAAELEPEVYLQIPLEDDNTRFFKIPRSQLDKIVDGASDIIQACLDLPWFKPATPNTRASLNDEAFRKGFYEHVVMPLYELDKRLSSGNTDPAEPSSAGINT